MKTLTIIAAFLLSAFSIYGQDKSELRDRLESQKVAFITTELNMTAAEAQGFWPIYNEYNDKRANAKAQQIDLRNNNSIEELTESEAATLVESILSHQENEVALKRAYTEELKTAISSKKIAKLFILEKEFKDKLMSKIRRKMKRKSKASDQ